MIHLIQHKKGVYELTPMGNFYPSGNTAKKIGKEYGVSKATIERDAEFSKAVDKVAEKVGKEAKNYEIT